MTWLSRYWELVILAIVYTAIIAPLLLPGYVLALDMVWVPDLQAVWQTETFNNLYPLHVLFALLGGLMPSWVVQKLLFLVLFGALLLVPWRYLPLATGWPRVMAAMLYAVNPFVYTRLLAGQWGVLLGYALLPLLLYLLWEWVKQPTWQASVRLAAGWSLVALVSVHYAYITAIVIGAVGIVTVCRQSNYTLTLRQLMLVALISAVLTSYWTVPALQRAEPLEERFDITHTEAFAASAHGDTLSVYSNVAVLGGFWAEDSLWLHTFWWPQTQPVFWVGWAAVTVLMLLGLAHLWHTARQWFWVSVGSLLALYVLSLGAADTLAKTFNIFLYETMPGWSGLRDSTKLVGLMAVGYSVLFGVGVQQLLMRPWARQVSAGLLIVPMLVGVLMWGGARGQLTPTWYPDSWFAAKEMISQAEGQTLVLPWRGYYSLEFADDRTIANVASRFFGSDRVIVGRSVETGEVTNQESDQAYQAVEDFLVSTTGYGPDITADWLMQQNITHLLVLSDRASTSVGNWWLPTYAPRAAEARIIPQLLQVPHTIIIDEDIRLYQYAPVN